MSSTRKQDASSRPTKRTKTFAAPSSRVGRSPPSISSTAAIDDPKTIVTWNADGLAARAKNARDAISRFNDLLRSTRPDLVCIQEARLKAFSPSRRGEPLKAELDAVEPLFGGGGTTRDDYEFVWSLADGRNAGTLLLIRRDLFPANEDDDSGSSSASGRRRTVEESSAFSVPGALHLLLGAYGLEDDAELKRTVADCDVGATTNGGASAGQKRQASVASFFKPKKTNSTASAAATATTSSSSSSSSRRRKHHPEGRIQFVRFANLDVLHTYVPNNGMKPESFERRKKFDADMRHFLSVRRQILSKAGPRDRPILWVGDLNVARTHLDGTHHVVDSNGAIEEYFTNEAKCGWGTDGKAKVPNRDPGTMGMPGFTPNERRRFERTLTEHNLGDVWRTVHPRGVQSESLPYLPEKRGGILESNRWNKAEYTWRGSTGSNFSKARYQGKAMRIDYFLLSNDAIHNVESCTILGYGEYREGYFCGSDHCASVLVFKDMEKKNE